MKSRYWSLVVVLILVNYLIFATLFTRLLETDFSRRRPTRTPIPTFTPASVGPLIVVPTPEPVTPEPSPTPTPVVPTPSSRHVPAGGASQASQTVGSLSAQLVSPGAVNIRSGPGLNFEAIGTLNPGTVLPIVGRNAERSWWQVEITNGTLGWVSNAVVKATLTENVPLVDHARPVSAQPVIGDEARSEFQYEPIGWRDNGGANLTQFSGEIVDRNGTPVNGTSIQASCGDYSIISKPSGSPSGQTEGQDWPAGFYELAIDTKPVPCLWVLTIVEVDSAQNFQRTLSEPIPVEVTLDKSNIVANWRKNW